MENLFRMINITSNGDEKAFKYKSKRKASYKINEREFEFVKPLEFKDYGEDGEDGFVAIESTSRIKVLKAKLQKPSLILMAPQYTQQVEKKRKVVKPKKNVLTFQAYGGIKSGWQEVEEFIIPSLSKLKVGLEIETLNEVAQEKIPVFNKSFINVRPNKPINLSKVESHFSLEELNLSKDFALVDAFNNYKPKPNELCFLIPEYIFYILCSLPKKEYPFNLFVQKNGNKYQLFSSNTKDNAFAFIQCYNESLVKTCSESEIELAMLSEQALAFTGIFYSAVAAPVKTEIGNISQYLKVKLDDRITIFTKARVDSLCEVSGEPLLIKSIHEYGSKWTNFDKKHSELIDQSFKNNSPLVTEWIVQSILTKAKEIVIGFMLSGNDGDPLLIKIEKKYVSDLKKLFNLTDDDCFTGLRFCLESISKLKESNTYIFHKTPLKPVIKILTIPTDE